VHALRHALDERLAPPLASVDGSLMASLSRQTPVFPGASLAAAIASAISFLRTHRDTSERSQGPRHLRFRRTLQSAPSDMRLTLDWLHTIVLLGAVQGVFLAGALAARRSNRTANRLLAAAMLSFSLYLATTVYHTARLEQDFPHFFGLGYPTTFLFGPLIYLYAAAASDRSRRLARRDVLHFAPFVAVVLGGLPIYLSSGAEKLAFYQRILDGDLPLLVRVADPLKFASGISYTVATLLLLRRHRERVKESYSSIERVNLLWLVWIGGSGAAIWAMATAFGVLGSTGIVRIARSEDFISLSIAVLVYSIGYRGLQQREILRLEGPEPPASDAVTPAEEDEPPRYERSGLTDAEAGRLETALRAVMERDRPWTDSGLTLADLAVRLDTTPHKLSEVLNSQVGETFYDFVNGYRVREVQRRIAAGEAKGLKILALALEAGFASKSTFNQVFKKHTNRTPSDYRQAAGA
jgi:AraC-like DNA-binding protein